MNPVEKALWYIEGHLQQDITLGDVAASAGVSRHHLLRAFAAATGMSVMRYVRGRRLSAAAARLAAGADNILGVAIDCGYSSHEAFTRAFAAQFGATPAELRTRGQLTDISVVEPISLPAPSLPIDPPRFETLEVLFVAGVNRRYAGYENSAGVPAQWESFATDHSRITSPLGTAAYGICTHLDDEGSMDYLCGVQVSRFTGQPADFTCLRVPRRRYAVFVHREHIASIRRTWDAIWNGWLPQSGHEVADAPMIERYEDHVHPMSGHGRLELLVPLS